MDHVCNKRMYLFHILLRVRGLHRDDGDDDRVHDDDHAHDGVLHRGHVHDDGHAHDDVHVHRGHARGRDVRGYDDHGRDVRGALSLLLLHLTPEPNQPID